jgi:hypothetical protein
MSNKLLAALEEVEDRLRAAIEKARRARDGDGDNGDDDASPLAPGRKPRVLGVVQVPGSGQSHVGGNYGG